MLPRSNRCPACREVAITYREKAFRTRGGFFCRHCNAGLRINTTVTGVMFLLTGLAILLPYSYFGFTSRILINAVLCLLIFIGVLCLTPLEIDSDSDHSL